MNAQLCRDWCILKLGDEVVLLSHYMVMVLDAIALILAVFAASWIIKMKSHPKLK